MSPVSLGESVRQPWTFAGPTRESGRKPPAQGAPGRRIEPDIETHLPRRCRDPMRTRCRGCYFNSLSNSLRNSLRNSLSNAPRRAGN